ncbi:MAG TPA: hypothetical protein VFK31_09525 [Rhodanobacteraceae bacterium]|nr:hypothetical protein [Rhodanobacteraceae bacterium]
MNTTRIYTVWNKADPLKPRLVRASNKSQALRHVAEDTFGVSVASQEALLDCIQRGVDVEDAGKAEESESEEAAA